MGKFGQDFFEGLNLSRGFLGGIQNNLKSCGRALGVVPVNDDLIVL